MERIFEFQYGGILTPASFEANSKRLCAVLAGNYLKKFWNAWVFHRYMANVNRRSRIDPDHIKLVALLLCVLFEMLGGIPHPRDKKSEETSSFVRCPGATRGATHIRSL
jgi:hypothetical protein